MVKNDFSRSFGPWLSATPKRYPTGFLQFFISSKKQQKYSWVSAGFSVIFHLKMFQGPFASYFQNSGKTSTPNISGTVKSWGKKFWIQDYSIKCYNILKNQNIWRWSLKKFLIFAWFLQKVALNNLISFEGCLKCMIGLLHESAFSGEPNAFYRIKKSPKYNFFSPLCHLDNEFCWDRLHFHFPTKLPKEARHVFLPKDSHQICSHFGNTRGYQSQSSELGKK